MLRPGYSWACLAAHISTRIEERNGMISYAFSEKSIAVGLVAQEFGHFTPSNRRRLVTLIGQSDFLDAG